MAESKDLEKIIEKLKIRVDLANGIALDCRAIADRLYCFESPADGNEEREVTGYIDKINYLLNDLETAQAATNHNLIRIKKAI